MVPTNQCSDCGCLIPDDETICNPCKALIITEQEKDFDEGTLSM